MAFKLASLFVEIGAQDGPLSRALDGIRGRLNALAGMRFNVPGGGFTAALGLAGAGALIGQAVSGASDLSETISKVGAVYGDYAKIVTDSADSMAKAYGIPKREYLDAASQFGLIATGMGMAKAEAAGFSVTMAKAAADAASFYNVPVAVALEKIRAGLTGESEPLKAFGVLMDEDAVKAYAVAKGLAKAGKELDNTAKLAARQGLILKGLAPALGDLEKTQDGAANSSRKFWGTLTNLGDTLGAVILPGFTKFLGLANEVATDLARAAESGTGAWASFVQGFTSAIDTATLVYRNFGDIAERTSVSIGGFLMNVWEYMNYGADVAAETAKFVWQEFLNAFEILGTIAVNSKDNLIAVFKEIWDYVASGFKDPIEVKLKPILEGIQLKGDGVLKLPPLNLSNVDNQLDAIDKRMQDRADAAAQGKGKGGKGVAAAAVAAGGGAAQAAIKHGVTDSDTYARELQEGALKGADVQKDILAEAKEQTKALGEIKKNTAKTGLMAAMDGLARWA